MDQKMSLDELDNITTGIPASALQASDLSEMSSTDLDNIRAGMPVAMVEEQMRYIEGLNNAIEPEKGVAR